MADTTPRVPVHGSERKALYNAQSVGAAPPDERFEVTVRLRRRTALPSQTAQAVAPLGKRRYLSREEFASQHGADPADVDKLSSFARAHQLSVVGSSIPRRSVFLSGTVAQFAAAFGTKIEHFEHDGGTYRGRTGPLTVPADLQPIVEGVFGIDDRPAAQPHFQVRPAPVGEAEAARKKASVSFTPPQVAALYDFPTGVDGTGECIALIELGGGYRPADLKTYFKSLGIAKPKVVAIRVDGAKNHPTNADSADGEVMLDIEVAAAVAPKATIAVYFAPNTDKGFLDAITMAIHDTTHKPSVISISWGSPEKDWTAQSLTSFDAAFQSAAALGVTVCAAAGDAGSGDENPDALAQSGAKPDGLAHADFPASSPHVLGCGGTRLAGSGHTISSEIVWDDDPLRSASGGGVSDVFAVPDYQASADVPPSANAGHKRGRGVPDVAGNADPNSGYQVRVDGQNMVIGGTSAVAPLWAGLIALMNQKHGQPVGFLNPLLYGSVQGKQAFHDITSGTNGAYKARAGWDACTGWGSPDGSKLLAAL